MTQARRREAEQFAAQVLGLDGVSDDPPPPGSQLARVIELKARCDAEGRSEEEFTAAVAALLDERL